MSDRPIGDHAFLSDCHSSALVATDGSVEWLAFPRFDSPSACGRLLDDTAGHFRVGVADAAEVRRRYVDGSLVLETTFRTADGVLRLTDALAVGVGERGHELGRAACSAAPRRVRRGPGPAGGGSTEFHTCRHEFAPRPEYGFTRPLLCATARGVVTRGSPDRLALDTEVGLTIDGGRAAGQVELTAGDEVGFALQWSRAWEDVPDPWDPARVRDRLDDTLTAWSSWADQHQGYDGPRRDLVRFSGAVLQGLTFQPTGAIVAAPTTSLPETVGGTRNWDYRYAWLRDASMTLDTLWVAACPDEAHTFVSWLVGAAAADQRSDAPIQIMYGIAGEHDLAERTLDHLDGWRGSRPVRVGNGAFDQRQLDVYGEVLDAVFRLRDQLVPLDEVTRRFLVDLADTAAREWQDPDQGIWEVRGGPRHFLYSKLMCWVALDRACQLADDLDATSEHVARWTETRDEIRTAILEQGFNERVGAFTQAFGSDVLDASALRIPIVGFLPADDDRVRATVAAVAGQLTDDRGFVYRYRHDDGLSGDEGTFCCARSGSPRPTRWRVRPTVPASCSRSRSGSATTSTCSPRSTATGCCSATSRRRSATSGSSTPRGRSPRLSGPTRRGSIPPRTVPTPATWQAEPPTKRTTMTTEYNYARFDDYVEHGREQDEFAAFANRLHVGVPAPAFEATRLNDGAVVDVAICGGVGGGDGVRQLHVTVLCC